MKRSVQYHWNRIKITKRNAKAIGSHGMSPIQQPQRDCVKYLPRQQFSVKHAVNTKTEERSGEEFERKTRLIHGMIIDDNTNPLFLS